MNIVDITVDVETCSLCPTSAVMSIGAVAWNRRCDDTPFHFDSEKSISTEHSQHIDLRSAFLDGFTFDQDTADWWSRQSEDAKQSLLSNDEGPVVPLRDAIEGFFLWVKYIKDVTNADDVYLWSQGSDFDIAILRNICHKYGLEIPVKYTNFRDHRTFYLEGARIICERAGSEFDPKTAYKLVEQYDGKGAPHDPIFDCKRSIYSTWQMMKHLSCLNIEK